jgi:hypothetical protein
MLLFSSDPILYMLIFSIIFSMKLNRNDSKQLIARTSAEPDMVSPILSNGVYCTERKSYMISYDMVLQLNSVMAIIYIEQGNRSRRLGDLRTAKECYQMAIRAHEYNRQVFINVHNL